MTASNQQILVLGGAGFIGSNLVHALVAAGNRPRVFARPSRSNANLRYALDRIDIVRGDFMDDGVLKGALKGIDVVVHLITTTFPNMVIESSNYDLLSNLLPTVRMLELAREVGVSRIVYASSGGTIYGEPKHLPIRETHPLEPISAYGQSKLTIENYLHFNARTTALETTVLRLSNPFGPGQNVYGAQGLIGVAMGCAIDDRPLKVFGDGNTVRDYVYIDDVTRALLIAINAPPTVVNISSGRGKTVNEVIAAIEEVSGKRVHRESLPARTGDVAVSVLDNALAREKLHWQPDMSFETGIERTWAAIHRALGPPEFCR